MLTLRVVLCCWLSLLAFSGKSVADVVDWKKVGWWDISFYPALNACAAYADYESEVNFLIGFDATQGDILLTISIFSEKWNSIEDGKEYEVLVAFGNETPWTLEMVGGNFEGFYGLDIDISADSEQAAMLANEFMREVSMHWTYNGVTLGELSLTDSRSSMGEVFKCTKSYREATLNDPFASGASKESDPFD